MPLRELAQAAVDGALPDGGIALTFDDGYVDNLTAGAPLLSEYNAPATMFLVAERLTQRRGYWWDCLAWLLLDPAIRLPPVLDIRVYGERRAFGTATCDDRRASHSGLYAMVKAALPAVRDEIMRQVAEAAGVQVVAAHSDRPMLLDEMRRLVSMAGVDIGAHGLHHVSLPGLARDDLYREVFECRTALERGTDTSVSLFAYPYGDVSSDAVRMVRAADYRYAVTCEERPLRAREDPLRLPRLLVPPAAGEAFAEWLARATAS